MNISTIKVVICVTCLSFLSACGGGSRQTSWTDSFDRPLVDQQLVWANCRQITEEAIPDAKARTPIRLKRHVNSRQGIFAAATLTKEYDSEVMREILLNVYGDCMTKSGFILDVS